MSSLQAICDPFDQQNYFVQNTPRQAYFQNLEKIRISRRKFLSLFFGPFFLPFFLQNHNNYLLKQKCEDVTLLVSVTLNFSRKSRQSRDIAITNWRTDGGRMDQPQFIGPFSSFIGGSIMGSSRKEKGAETCQVRSQGWTNEKHFPLMNKINYTTFLALGYCFHWAVEWRTVWSWMKISNEFQYFLLRCMLIP